MPDQGYGSVGAAFSSGMEEYMTRQAVAERQKMLDNLAIEKEHRLLKNEDEDSVLRKQEFAERKSELDQTNRWKDEAQKREAKKLADKEAADAAQAAGRAAFVAGLPEGPQKTAYQGEQFGLHNVVPPKEAAGAGAEPIARQNPRSGVVERLVDGQWQSVTGDVPKGTHFMTEPAPKDTTARDAAAAARDAATRDKAYGTAIKDMEKAEAPFTSHLQSLNDLDNALAARTPAADALIGPLVLKSTISGTGTGFRMTRAEIENVVGGRSKWESLKAAAQKWSTDPKAALSITEEQRQELRDLSTAIRKNTNSYLTKASKARHEMDSMEDGRAIEKRATQLVDEFNAPVEEEKAKPNRIVYDMNGKPVKQ